MKKTKMICIAAFVCYAVIATSCSKETEITAPANETPATPQTKVEVVNGLLVFADQASLNAITSGKESLSAIPFVSQKNLLDKLAEAEGKQVELFKNGTTATFEHSNLYFEYLKKGLIREIFHKDGTNEYETNLAAPYYTHVTNEEGFFAVGDTIYQVTPTLLKIWQNGDIKNYKALDKVIASDEAQKILVIDYTQTATAKTRALFPVNHIDQKRGACRLTNENNTRYCIIFYDKLITITSPNSYKRETYIQIKRQDKVGGSWTSNNSFNYYYFANIYAREKNAGEVTYFGGEGSGNSADVYYSLNFDYRMILQGQNQYDYIDTYWYITEYTVSLNPIGIGVFSFDGERQTPTSGPFSYYLNPNDPANVQWITDL